MKFSTFLQTETFKKISVSHVCKMHFLKYGILLYLLNTGLLNAKRDNEPFIYHVFWQLVTIIINSSLPNLHGFQVLFNRSPLTCSEDERRGVFSSGSIRHISIFAPARYEKISISNSSITRLL